MERIFLKILIVTKDETRFSVLAAALQRQQETRIVFVATGVTGLAFLKGKQVDLAIVDEQLDDISGIDFVKLLVKAYPLVNTAIVSMLTTEEFHEATEGLGVLLQLPREPREMDAARLLGILEKICVLLQPLARQRQKVGQS